MKIVIVRHGKAASTKTGQPDEARFLTSEGRAFFRKTAKTMLKQGVDPSLILTSPRLRAVQTAEILAERLSFVGPLLVRPELGNGFDLEAFQGVLADYEGADEIVLVGHDPDLSALVAALLSMSSGFDLKKGAAVKLKIDPKRPLETAVFKWVVEGNDVSRKQEED